MTPTRFVETLALLCVDQVVEGELETLRDPPGRKPALSTVAKSEWFNGLSSDDQAQVAQLSRTVAFSAVFGVLAVMDGVRSISEIGEDGELQLLWRTAAGDVDLTDFSEGDLHDLLKGTEGKTNC